MELNQAVILQYAKDLMDAGIINSRADFLKYYLHHGEPGKELQAVQQVIQNYCSTKQPAFDLTENLDSDVEILCRLFPKYELKEAKRLLSLCSSSSNRLETVICIMSLHNRMLNTTVLTTRNGNNNILNLGLSATTNVSNLETPDQYLPQRNISTDLNSYMDITLPVPKNRFIRHTPTATVVRPEDLNHGANQLLQPYNTSNGIPSTLYNHMGAARHGPLRYENMLTCKPLDELVQIPTTKPEIKNSWHRTTSYASSTSQNSTTSVKTMLDEEEGEMLFGTTTDLGILNSIKQENEIPSTSTAFLNDEARPPFGALSDFAVQDHFREDQHTDMQPSPHHINKFLHDQETATNNSANDENADLEVQDRLNEAEHTDVPPLPLYFRDFLDDPESTNTQSTNDANVGRKLQDPLERIGHASIHNLSNNGRDFLYGQGPSTSNSRNDSNVKIQDNLQRKSPADVQPLTPYFSDLLKELKFSAGPTTNNQNCQDQLESPAPSTSQPRNDENTHIQMHVLRLGRPKHTNVQPLPGPSTSLSRDAADGNIKLKDQFERAKDRNIQPLPHYAMDTLDNPGPGMIQPRNDANSDIQMQDLCLGRARYTNVQPPPLAVNMDRPGPSTTLPRREVDANIKLNDFMKLKRLYHYNSKQCSPRPVYDQNAILKMKDVIRRAQLKADETAMPLLQPANVENIDIEKQDPLRVRQINMQPFSQPANNENPRPEIATKMEDHLERTRQMEIQPLLRLTNNENINIKVEDVRERARQISAQPLPQPANNGNINAKVEDMFRPTTHKSHKHTLRDVESPRRPKYQRMNNLIVLNDDSETSDESATDLLNIAHLETDGRSPRSVRAKECSSPAASYSIKLSSHIMEMFPNACPNYIKKLCRGREMTDADVDEVLQIMFNEPNYPKRSQREPTPPIEMELEAQTELLKEIFPDADPTYLEYHAEIHIADTDGMKDFISRTLEYRDYPTKKEYLRRQQLNAQVRQYTTEFKVDKFLEVISDPIKYFGDVKRRTFSEKDAVEQHLCIQVLKNIYPHVTARHITALMGKKYANLMAIANKLNKCLDSKLLVKSKRKTVPVDLSTLQNIPLLQEITFLRNRDIILESVAAKKEQDLLEREEAKANGLMQVCKCCYDDEVMFKDCVSCENGCNFCKSCVQKSIEIIFAEGKVNFPCLDSCTASFNLTTLRDALPPKLFSKVALRKQVEEVKAAGIDDLITCPFCDFATIPPPGDKIFKCLNPECMKESCRECKEPSHVPLRCDEIEKDDDVKKRVYIENKMTEALVRICYKCGMKFIKEDGCNKMTCSCGAQMCYLCLAPVKDYKHFNGQGGDKHHLCPLYSDTNKMHEAQVLQGAATAKQELGVGTDEKLKNDPTADVHKYYEKRRGAHPPHQVPDQIPPIRMLVNAVMEIDGINQALIQHAHHRHLHRHHRHQ